MFDGAKQVTCNDAKPEGAIPVLHSSTALYSDAAVAIKCVMDAGGTTSSLDSAKW